MSGHEAADCPRLTGADLRAVFDAVPPGTVGLEEEVLLLEARSFEPSPVAAEVAARTRHHGIRTELPACQVEVATRPSSGPHDALADLAAGRAAIAEACGDEVVPVAAAVHPLALGPAVLATSDRCRALAEEYGEVASRQLVGALQVHVAVGGADATLAVHNTLRNHLPELAALAAAAPFHEGRDTGLASVRPLICTQLPRQGVPPVIADWDAFADDLDWGRASGRVPEAGRWWWEVRPHVRHGTVEVRVPDVQPTLDAARAVAATVHALVRFLAARHADGRSSAPAQTWRIEENRWAALRHGTHGQFADLETGEPTATADRLHRLLDEIEPWSERDLDHARALVDHPTADWLRSVGIARACPALAEEFTR